MYKSILLELLIVGGAVTVLMAKDSTLFSNLKGRLGLPNKDWWIKIRTHAPTCTYFFGPFDTSTEAQGFQGGFLEDLINEGAQDISMKIRQYQPTILTIEEA